MPDSADSATRAERRQRRTFRRRCLVAAGAVVAIVAVVTGAALALSGGSDTKKTASTRHRPKPVPTSTTTTVPADTGPFVVATSAVPKLNVHEQPSTASAVITTLKATTSYGLTTTLLTDPRQASVDKWVAVLAPLHKPNDTPGWVQQKDVTLSPNPYEIVISLSTYTLWLRNAGQDVLSTKVIIGAPQSPTPVGRFYLTDPVNCNKMSVPGYPLAKCRQVYGAFAIGTSGLSDTLDSFSGTIAQIAIHGTNLPTSEMGQQLSNGCVRIPNDIILQIAKITPLLGTPVIISGL